MLGIKRKGLLLFVIDKLFKLKKQSISVIVVIVKGKVEKKKKIVSVDLLDVSFKLEKILVIDFRKKVFFGKKLLEKKYKMLRFFILKFIKRKDDVDGDFFFFILLFYFKFLVLINFIKLKKDFILKLNDKIIENELNNDKGINLVLEIIEILFFQLEIEVDFSLIRVLEIEKKM